MICRIAAFASVAADVVAVVDVAVVVAVVVAAVVVVIAFAAVVVAIAFLSRHETILALFHFDDDGLT